MRRNPHTPSRHSPDSLRRAHQLQIGDQSGLGSLSSTETVTAGAPGNQQQVPESHPEVIGKSLQVQRKSAVCVEVLERQMQTKPDQEDRINPSRPRNFQENLTSPTACSKMPATKRMVISRTQLSGRELNRSVLRKLSDIEENRKIIQHLTEDISKQMAVTLNNSKGNP